MPQQLLDAKPLDIPEDVWATLCAIAFLEFMFKEEKHLWELSTRKARIFIIKHFHSKGSKNAVQEIDNLMEIATKIISQQQE